MIERGNPHKASHTKQMNPRDNSVIWIFIKMLHIKHRKISKSSRSQNSGKHTEQLMYKNLRGKEVEWALRKHHCLKKVLKFPRAANCMELEYCYPLFHVSEKMKWWSVWQKSWLLDMYAELVLQKQITCMPHLHILFWYSPVWSDSC